MNTVREGRLLLGRLDQWLLNEIRNDLGARVLEIGCGYGNLIALLLDRELVIGTDSDAASVALVRRRFRDYVNVRAHTFDVTTAPSAELVGYAVDTVISLNVLEHIEQDRIALRNMLELLHTGRGTLITIVPSHRFLYGTMDRAIGHFRRYTKAMMEERLVALGARVKRQFYVNVAGALGWWFAGHVLRCTTPPEGQLSLFNRLVPFFELGERWLKPPFGLSLVTVATFQ